MTQENPQDEALRKALIEGEESGDAGILDMELIQQEAKQEEGILLSTSAYQAMKRQALQQAITDGINSGVPSPLNMDDIKQKAREKMGINVKR